MSDGLISGVLAKAEAGHGTGAWWGPVVWLVAIFLVIAILLKLALNGAKENVPKNPLTRLAEHVYLFIENMCLSVIGPHGKKYVTLVLTVYLVILFSNLFGLVGLFAPTSMIGITLALAVVVVFYVQFEGIRANNPVGYVKHFAGPDLGIPWWKGGIVITLLIFFIELVSEVAKNLSLSLRLQGNISGEHKVSETLGNLVNIGGYEIPVQWLLMPLGVFVCVVQALVFTMLTCVYLSLFTSHDAEEGHAH
jgi:F-type H+-transporting ATPase subunit a